MAAAEPGHGQIILVESLADELASDSLGILLSKAVGRHGRVNPRIATQATLEASPRTPRIRWRKH